MEFIYKLDDAGWALGSIEINSQEAYFSPSYLSDALYELLKSLISITPELVSFPVRHATFEWLEEPGGIVWTLERIDSKNINVKIVSYEDMYSKKELGTDLNETCSFLEFVHAVINTLDLILQKHGVDGYKEKWINHEFPMKQFLLLKGLIVEGDR
ncbi:hypothetical protein [Paenibacillus sp. V4I5]|uniref:hypothetical protein n=1 Tax=Paenibacillus sp. V4I5 TaxID=3042306 RepID=UPI0027913A14|nr:hypothetical protein [Paenibacillus sp. V4I5]MDQ0914652.1 hypothetical protein [Paenibacillus sp. V4I5]